MSLQSSQPQPRRTRLAWWRWAILAVLVIALGWIGWLLLSLKGAEDKMYQPLPQGRSTVVVGQHGDTPTPSGAIITQSVASGTPHPTLPANPPAATPITGKLNETARFNILLMGVDERPNIEAARSDTMMLVSIDPVKKTAAFISIPRDMAVQIPGYGEHKMNAAYFYGEYYKEPGGGAALAVATVEKLFGVPIKYYVTINFSGFEKVVDALGGVDINVPYAIDDYEYPTPDNGTMRIHFNAGQQHMDGATALIYVRTRHADGDFARQARQRQLITALRSRALQLDVLPRIPGIISSVGDAVRTNISFDEQIGLVRLLTSMGNEQVVQTAISPEMIYAYSGEGDLGDSFKLDFTAANNELAKLFGGDYGYKLVEENTP